MNQKHSTDLLEKSLSGEFLNNDEILHLYKFADFNELAFYADLIRKKYHPDNIVTYIIDRNINYTNICYSQCKFCNFCRKSNDHDVYVLELKDYESKIDELYLLDGRQILLQGGMNPKLDLEYYQSLFKQLKKSYPDIKLHALGPPEIVFLANKSKKSIRQVLEILIEAGLDSLPGAGAEILCDRVRNIISPAKCSSAEWLEVMKIAQEIGLTTSATMMFGHIETMDERVEHLLKIRELQNKKPNHSKGFISFTPWPFAKSGTKLVKEYPFIPDVSAIEFLRIIALSRIVLLNIPNIQVSWLTMGAQVASLALHCGANDMSSIMIEENVVSQAGKNFKLDEDAMKKAISEAGFIPRRRNQQYEILNEF